MRSRKVIEKEYNKIRLELNAISDKLDGIDIAMDYLIYGQLVEREEYLIPKRDTLAWVLSYHKTM